MTLADEFLAFDAELARNNVPPLSPWWRTEVARFLTAHESGEAMEFWNCVGRGGAKSTAIYKLALFQTLFGKFSIPADEIHFAVIISRTRTEAEKGLAILCNWLRKLGVEFRAVGDFIQIAGMPRGIRVVSASVGAASGWRCFHLATDEYAKWATDGALELDAEEILASARAMTITHTRAMVHVASSPWLSEGSFYQAITAGDGDGRVVAGPAPSWVANPIISQAACRSRERNERRFQREYACCFVDSFEGGFFPPELVLAATDRGRTPTPNMPTNPRGHVVCIDPAFSFDRFAVVIAHSQAGRDGPVVVIDHVSTIDPPRGANLSPEHAAAVVCSLRKRFLGDCAVRTDQAFAATLSEIFLRRGVPLLVEPWTAEVKRARFELVRSLLADRRIRLPDCAATRRELNAIGLKLTHAGNEVVTSRAAHDDRVSALVHAAFVAHRQSPSYGRGGEGAHVTPKTITMAQSAYHSVFG